MTALVLPTFMVEVRERYLLRRILHTQKPYHLSTSMAERLPTGLIRRGSGFDLRDKYLYGLPRGAIRSFVRIQGTRDPGCL